jgi:hypothetical protein
VAGEASQCRATGVGRSHLLVVWHPDVARRPEGLRQAEPFGQVVDGVLPRQQDGAHNALVQRQLYDLLILQRCWSGAWLIRSQKREQRPCRWAVTICNACAQQRPPNDHRTADSQVRSQRTWAVLGIVCAVLCFCLQNCWCSCHQMMRFRHTALDRLPAAVEAAEQPIVRPSVVLPRSNWVIRYILLG